MSTLKRIPNKAKWLADLIKQAQEWKDDNEAYAILAQLAAYPYLIPRCVTCDTLLQYESEVERSLCNLCESVRYHAQRKTEWLAKVAAMTYTEYCRSDHWNNYRIATLNRTDYRCDVCRLSTPEVGTLQVYHHTKANLGCEIPADVIVLCSKCRAEYTGAIVNE